MYFEQIITDKKAIYWEKTDNNWKRLWKMKLMRTVNYSLSD